MKNKFICFILLVGLVSILAGCGEDAEKEDLVRSSYPDDLRNSETITICAQQTAYSLSDDVELLLDIENNSTKDVAADEYFQLEKKVEGEWYIVPIATNTKDISLRIPAENTFEGFSIELTKEQTTDLTPGDYRVIKKIGDKDVAAYFSFTK